MHNILTIALTNEFVSKVIALILIVIELNLDDFMSYYDKYLTSSHSWWV